MNRVRKNIHYIKFKYSYARCWYSLDNKWNNMN